MGDAEVIERLIGDGVVGVRERVVSTHEYHRQVRAELIDGQIVVGVTLNPDGRWPSGSSVRLDARQTRRLAAMLVDLAERCEAGVG